MRLSIHRNNHGVVFIFVLFLTACGRGAPQNTYSVGGTITGLAPGNSITLTNNSNDSVTLNSDGPFTFHSKLNDGAAYSLTLSVTTPTAQPCSSTYGAGNIRSANITSLNVFCGLPGGSESFTGTGTLLAARLAHTATLLRNGKVLVVGGDSDGTGSSPNSLASAELYDPASGTWASTGSLTTARSNHTATLLQNGKVLVVGGMSDSGTSSTLPDTAELYDPDTGLWTVAGSLATARFGHTATLLPDGKVLVIGGVTDHIGSVGAANAELYDPASGTWSDTKFQPWEIAWHCATLLPNGKVLVSGGGAPMLDNNTGFPILATYLQGFLYEPDSGSFTLTGQVVSTRYDHSATLLPDGKVLVSGGRHVGISEASAELYYAGKNAWTATGSLATPRSYHTATLLPNGKVLVSGGYDATFTPLANAELYDPISGSWSTVGSLATARDFHTTTLLQNGKVLVSGGMGMGRVVLDSAELYF